MRSQIYTDEHRLSQPSLRQITETREYQQLLAELRANARVISISGLVAGAARALAVAALQRESGKTFAVVSQTTRDLEPWERDLRFWYAALSGKETADDEILVLPASETDPYAGVSPHAQTLERPLGIGGQVLGKTRQDARPLGPLSGEPFAQAQRPRSIRALSWLPSAARRSGRQA